MNNRKILFEYDDILYSLLVRYFDVIIDVFMNIDYFINNIFIEEIYR